MDRDLPPGFPGGGSADPADRLRRSDAPSSVGAAGTYVVEVPFLIPEGRLEPIVASVAEDLAVPPERIRRVLAGRVGPVTRPVERAQAERVGRALRRAGVPAVVAPAEVRGAFVAPIPERSDGAVPAPVRAPAAPGGAAGSRGAPLSHSTLAGVAPAPRGGGGRPDPGARARSAVEEARIRRGAELGGGADGGVEDDEAAHVGDAWRFGDGGVARRRWWLAGSLVAALAALVALQVLWASPSVGGGEVGGAVARYEVDPYERGLLALRRGDFGAARGAWEAVADTDPRAAYLRGALAERGWGQPWSNAEASRWYRSAAERGHPAAARRLARLFETGMGVEQSFAEARAWYRRAAQGGDAPAAVRLADLLLAGAGGPVDAGEARGWLERAAAAGSLEAEGRLRLLGPSPAPALEPAPAPAPRSDPAPEPGSAPAFGPVSPVLVGALGAPTSVGRL